ncbi:alpha-glucosidase [Staphylococcus aureus]|uniref:Alpha-glucosidase n=1 Tax=Staphylococcus aureus TaxID=1280 RepID=A0A380EIF9_STAAU|nr:alpha-glucosidase [Staphylococcus aureus]VED74623.1 alpha-glucosidase [Staphylococcus aureus]
MNKQWWKEAVAYQVYPRSLMIVITMVLGIYLE